MSKRDEDSVSRQSMKASDAAKTPPKDSGEKHLTFRAVLEKLNAIKAELTEIVDEAGPERATAEECLSMARAVSDLERTSGGLLYRLLALMRARGDARVLGRGSLEHLLVHEAGLDRKGLRSRLRQAATFSQFPDAMAALTTGKLTAEQVEATTQAVRALTALGRPGDEEVREMLRLASVGPSATTLMRARAAVLKQELAETRRTEREAANGSNRQAGRSYLRWRADKDGMVHVEALLDPMQGPALTEPIECEVAQMLRERAGDSDAEFAGSDFSDVANNGDAPPCSGALYRAAGRAAAHQPDPTLAFGQDEIESMRVDALIRQLQRGMGDRDPHERTAAGARGGSRRNRRRGRRGLHGLQPMTQLVILADQPGTAVNQFGVAVPKVTVEQAACNALVDLIMLNGEERPAAAYRVDRLVTSFQRLALIRRDQFCLYPGCRIRAEFCEAHHIVPWDEGGEAVLKNLQSYCERHHSAIHREGEATSAEASPGPSSRTVIR